MRGFALTRSLPRLFSQGLAQRFVVAQPIARSYAKGPAKVSSQPSPEDAAQMASQTGVQDLHPIPESVQKSGAAAKASGPSSFTSTGNSKSPEALSTRPAAPGPSSPEVVPHVAAPGQTSRGGNQPQGSHQGGDNWSTSFQGMSTEPFDDKINETLQAPLNSEDIEIKPGEYLRLRSSLPN